MKNNTHLRQESIKRVFSEIRLRGPVSKRELQAITGFSWGNISSIITLLMNEQYIIVSGKQETYVGRKPDEFDINTNDNYIIGIDFNSEGALVLLCDLKGRVTKKYKTSFTEKHKDGILNALYSLLEKVIEDNKAKNMLHIAIAMQGEVDTEKGISVQSAAIDGWTNIPVCEEIAVLAENGEEKAKEIFAGSGNALGVALHNSISLLNPETVVVFGGFTRYAHLFLEETKRVLGQFSDKKAPEMVLSALNTDSAAVGASIFTADMVIGKLEFDE